MDFWQDLKAGLNRRQLWLFMGWRDVYRRYLRSVLGPLWLVLNAMLTVSILGPLYSFLFKIPMTDYVIYMTTGILSWQVIAQCFNEMPVIYLNNSSFITDVNLPFSTYHLQMLWRNLIIYANSILVILLITILFGNFNLAALALFPFGLILILLNCFLASSVIAALGARYRDVVPIITNLLQAMFFATPIIWKKEMLSQYAFINDFNPFFHVLEVLREPFLGNIPSPVSYAFLTVTAILGIFINLKLFPRVRARLAFWL